ncbi:hypothetical protein D7D52_36165 [Nocardia yunnanensis]|uniref:Uncharacterized protein n=1 Tax=Nocardia yunnanensis TaxID=2382165 RepID=A0A386ZKI3_9NOCA|nr:hypothetical protein [Nocardia yunnanensis]AYF78372.1 hypothetical protein D7D52_36165 [Nocardia yunnanensis]
MVSFQRSVDNGAGGFGPDAFFLVLTFEYFGQRCVVFFYDFDEAGDQDVKASNFGFCGDQLFIIWVRTMQYDVNWRIRIQWSTGVTSGEAVMDNDGRPFEVSPAGPGSHFCTATGNSWAPGYNPSGSKGTS